MNAVFLKTWYDYTKAHDHKLLWEMLHPDVVFESPVVHSPQKGREVTFKYLTTADKVLGSSGFQYVGEWQNETGAILEFVNEIHGVRINGIDMIGWDKDGLITHFKVMVRPLKAVNLLHQLMGAQLAKP